MPIASIAEKISRDARNGAMSCWAEPQAIAISSVLLQLAVVYVPFLQETVSTTALSVDDWLLCTALGSTALWPRELTKLISRSRSETLEAVA
jgi:hypothetical protein